MPGPRTKICSDILISLHEQRKKAETAFLGISARFKDGKYTGRWGIVRAVTLDDREGVKLMVQPYRSTIVGENGLPKHIVADSDLLWDHVDARSYRAVERYEYGDDYRPCLVCGRRVAVPCDNAEGFHEGGPWDSNCREYF